MKSFFINKINLKTKIIANVVLLHTILMLFICYEFYTHQRDFMYNEAQKNAVAISKNLSANAILWLLSNDITAMNELIESQKLNYYIQEAMILDKNNIVKSALDKSLVGIIPSDKISKELISKAQHNTYFLKHDNLIDVMSPIISKNVKIGSVRVIMTLTAIEEESIKVLEKAVIFSIIGILIGGFLAYFTISNAFKRLQQLVDSAKAIEAGQLDVKINVKGNNDEIDILSESIIAMVNSLKVIINKLQDLSVSLNERVKEEVDKQREHEALLITQSKIASMGEMVIAITHHWRQPLNKIALVIQVLEDEYKNGTLTQEVLSQHVSDIMSFVRHMSEVLQGFQNYFAHSRGEQQRESDIKIIAKDTIELFKQEILINKPLNVYINCKVHNKIFDEESKVIPCNEFKINRNNSLIEQIFLNLIKNSIESIAISDISFGELIIEFYRDNNLITIVIKDNGIGIKEDVIERIFDPFFTTKDSSVHTGLGLYIVTVILKKHLNGSIKVQNRPEGGCEFTITFEAGLIYDLN